MIEPQRYQVIALTDCPFCKKAVDLLKREKKKFSVLVVDHDQEMLLSMKNNTGHKTVPIIIGVMENGQQGLIGGFTDLEKFLSQPKEVLHVKKYSQSIESIDQIMNEQEKEKQNG